MNTSRHLTTRRGFVAAMGFGGVSLYGLWVAYGAAPGPQALFGQTSATEGPTAGDDAAMAGHGMGPSGPTVEEFRATVADFVDRFGQPDGSVYPQRPAEAAAVPAPMDMSIPGMVMPTDPSAPAMDHALDGAGAMATDAAAINDEMGDHHAAPVDVYMLAEQWFYEPAHLRLDAGTGYRFRLMAADVPHGASIQFGHGARMIRLAPNTVTEIALTFERPGSYLIYCTAYCGAGHDGMQARIDVI